MKLIKIEVCRDCLTPGYTHPDCICMYQNNYPTIELEFEECECCHQLKDEPADTKFNEKQLETLQNG